MFGSSLAILPPMFIMQPASALTISVACVSFSAATLSVTIAPEMSDCFTENVPPKPQHSLSWSCTMRSTFCRLSISFQPVMCTPISRRAAQEVCTATFTGAPTSLGS